jgi:selenocysteine-specific elongation factor
MNRHVIIGTAGHVDHGKTSLILSLTGRDTDRLKEEKKRGITIDLGFTYLSMPSGEKIGIIDVPGHERFVHNMLAGAGGIDIVLLVVAADEGVMPQTLEHLNILSLLNIKYGCVAITKIDMVDDEWLELMKEDLIQTLKGSFLENAPIIPVSSKENKNIDLLKNTLFEIINSLPIRNDSGLFRIPVDRVFSMPGFGTVITGTLIEGNLKVNEEVEIYPKSLLAKVRSLQVHDITVEKAFAGQRVAVNLSNIKTSELKRGSTLATPGTMQSSLMLDVYIQVLADSPFTIKHNSRVHFFHGTSEMLCKVVLLGGKIELYPGESTYAQLHFEEPICTKHADSFVLRFYSPVETIGGGTVLNPLPDKHKPSNNEIINKLKILHAGSLEEKLETLILEYSPHYMDIESIYSLLSIDYNKVNNMLTSFLENNRIIQLDTKIYIHIDFYNVLVSKSDDLLKKYHSEHTLSFGPPLEQYKFLMFKDVRPNIQNELINIFIDKNHIRITRDCVQSPAFKIVFTDKQQKLIDKIKSIFELSPFAPPEKNTLNKQFERNIDYADVMDYLKDSGYLIYTDSQIAFSSKNLDIALNRFRDLQKINGEVTLAELRDALDTSRKYALSILNYWDKKGITKMYGEARKLID